MLKIGDFSKLSRVSVRMLRYYDEIGLLKPAETDRFTDYRYYSEAQLPAVCRIQALRDMGFSLSEVRELLPVYHDRRLLADRLDVLREELARQRDALAERMLLLDTARERLRKEGPMNYDVTIRTLPERYAATVRMTIPRYEEEGQVWHVLLKETAHMDLIPADPCYCCVAFLDGEFKERDVTVEAQKTVKGTYPDTEHVKFRTLPAVTYAGCTFQGGYEQINDVIAALAEWIEANGYAYDGPMFDIYHVSPHETQNSEEFVTEVCYPVRRK